MICVRCIKVSLVPCASVSWTTKSTANLTAPDFSEVFNVPVEEHHLNAKTLQLHVWALHDTLGDHCLVSSFCFFSLKNVIWD